MGDLVDLERIRRDRQLRSALAKLRAEARGDLPTPEELGWRVLQRDADGTATRWMSLPYQAFIGVDVRSGRVYLDRRHRLLAWDDLTVEELAVGLETGFLPDPDVVLDALGDPDP